MDAILGALASSGPASWMRYSRWGYAGVNAAHILGIALLVGAILPLDLRLLGFWRRVPLEPLARILVPMAATGLLLAACTGALLFLAKPLEYAALGLFVVKLALVAGGAAHALSVHLGRGLLRSSPMRMRAIGLTSLALWIAALASGRLLAFVDP